MFQELSIIHGLTVTDIKQYSDYIPRYIEQMENIVADTYMKTRGMFYNTKLCEVYIHLSKNISKLNMKTFSFTVKFIPN